MVRAVKLLEVGSQDLVARREYPGRIAAATEADVSFEVGGRIVDLPVAQGQRVKKGQLLARLDPSDFQAQLDKTRAVRNAAAVDVQRFTELQKIEAVSRRELETRERNLEVAEADLRIAEKNRGATTLLAPFDGRVSRKHVERFQNVQPRQPIFLLQDTTRLEITVSLPEADLVRLERVMDLGALSRRLNPVVAVSSLPTDASFPARLTEIATAADPTTRTFEARLAFEAPPDLLLLPGMTAQVRIGAGLAERGSGFPIPARAAVIDANRAASVWKVDPKTMEVHKVAVELGAMAGDSVAVTRGLQRGDVIAVTGASQLRDGMRVRPLETR